jgi:hypothetical protein
MISRLCLAVSVVLCALSLSWMAAAENITSASGFTPAQVISVPYQFTSAGSEQHNVAITAATAPPSVPTGTLFAWMSVKGTAQVNCTYDGTTTPTATVGNGLLPGQYKFLESPAIIAATQCIQTAATSTLDFEYLK